MSGVRSYFDALAGEYESLPFVQSRDVAEEVNRILRVVRPDTAGHFAPTQGSLHVLDIGCGTGRLAWEIARRGYQVHGIDLSARMIERAGAASRRGGDDENKGGDRSGGGRDKTGARGDGVGSAAPQFSVADFFTFEPDAQYDLAVSVMGGAFGVSSSGETANYAEAARFFRALGRALAPGGEALIEFLHGACVIRELAEEHLQGGEVLFDRGKVLTEGGVYESYYTVTEVYSAAEACGLTVRGIFGPLTGGDFPVSLGLDDSVGVVHVAMPDESRHAE
ncbi:MAG: class I SAM-dependent DNA methyltransferase [bacterium]